MCLQEVVFNNLQIVNLQFVNVGTVQKTALVRCYLNDTNRCSRFQFIFSGGTLNKLKNFYEYGHKIIQKVTWSDITKELDNFAHDTIERLPQSTKRERDI